MECVAGMLNMINQNIISVIAQKLYTEEGIYENGFINRTFSRLLMETANSYRRQQQIY